MKTQCTTLQEACQYCLAKSESKQVYELILRQLLLHIAGGLGRLHHSVSNVDEMLNISCLEIFDVKTAAFANVLEECRNRSRSCNVSAPRALVVFNHTWDRTPVGHHHLIVLSLYSDLSQNLQTKGNHSRT